MPWTLSNSQYVIITLLGAALWAVATLMVRMLDALGALGGVPSLVVFALTIPLGFATMFVFRWIARVPWSAMAIAITWGTCVAHVLDAMAFTYAPQLFSTDPDVVRAGAGAIFFGAAAGMWAAIWASQAWGDEA